MANTKEKLRQRVLSLRNSLTEEEYLQKSREITEKLKQQPEFLKAQTIHCYVSLNNRNEVNTHPLIKYLLESRKEVVVPVTNFSNGSLSHKYLNEFDDLQENKWGVLEPEAGRRAQAGELQLVIVPMAGGDHDKNRIGYGKGFYDRFLSSLSCPTVGLLFDDCLMPQIPVEAHDVALSKIITEDRVIE